MDDKQRFGVTAALRVSRSAAPFRKAWLRSSSLARSSRDSPQRVFEVESDLADERFHDSPAEQARRRRGDHRD
ncbi:MAG: hypothetical protein ACXVH1_28230 [Solirubrobacteraceae bacterium]